MRWRGGARPAGIYPSCSRVLLKVGAGEGLDGEILAALGAVARLAGLEGPPDTEPGLLNPLALSNTPHDAGLVARVHDSGVLLGAKVLEGPVNGEALLAGEQSEDLFSLHTGRLLKVVGDLAVLGEGAVWQHHGTKRGGHGWRLKGGN